VRHSRLTRLREDQGGIILVEIVVSAMLLVIVALGVFTAFDAGTRATSEERHRARAHALAEADVERMRGMRIADLSGLNQTRNVTSDGQTYTIRSQAAFGTETATTSTCAAGTGSRDVLQVTSRVTWPTIGTRPAVTVSSVVSPPNSSVVPNSGSLLASVKDSRSVGVPGVSMSGTGAGSFTGTTGPGGCVLWRNLPQGNYNLSFGGAASGRVDPDGNSPTTQVVSVVAGSTNTVNYEFDSPGRIQNVAFRTRDYSNNLDPMTWDSFVVDHTSMQTARIFTSTTGRQLTMSTPTTMYPFVTPQSVYAGACGTNNPGTGLGLGSVTVPVGGTVTGPTVQLPSLQVTLFSGTSTTSSRVANGEVTVTDGTPGCNITRSLTATVNTNTNGQIPDDSGGRPMIGLPYSTDYDICATNGPNGTSTATRKRVTSNFSLTSSGATGTVLNVFFGASGTQIAAGGGLSCP
jgi:Tfp pilus assembly protein PilV